MEEINSRIKKFPNFAKVEHGIKVTDVRIREVLHERVMQSREY